MFLIIRAKDKIRSKFSFEVVVPFRRNGADLVFLNGIESFSDKHIVGHAVFCRDIHSVG